VLKQYIHGEKTYAKIRDLMNSEMEAGLSRSGHDAAAIKMFISYVQSLPDGSGMIYKAVCHVCTLPPPVLSCSCHGSVSGLY